MNDKVLECIIVKCTGEWEINIDNLKKVEGIPELESEEDMFGSRVFPYICFPDSTDKDAIIKYGRDVTQKLLALRSIEMEEVKK